MNKKEWSGGVPICHLLVVFSSSKKLRKDIHAFSLAQVQPSDYSEGLGLAFRK